MSFPTNGKTSSLITKLKNAELLRLHFACLGKVVNRFVFSFWQEKPDKILPIAPL
jgi:hypothetical protein